MVSLASSTCCSSLCAASCAESSSSGPASGSAALSCSCSCCSWVMTQDLPMPARAQKGMAAQQAQADGECYDSDETSGSRMERVSGARLYGCSSLTSSSWYTDSALTAQMSCFAPVTMLSTARIAVSIEWSELLYRCRPLRPTCWRFEIPESQPRMASTRCE